MLETCQMHTFQFCDRIHVAVRFTQLMCMSQRGGILGVVSCGCGISVFMNKDMDLLLLLFFKKTISII